MNKYSLSLLAMAAFAILLLAPQAQALSARTYVSSSGSDTNDCSRSSPCRTFQAALNATAASGIVGALDSGEYGPVTINQKPVTISGEGVEAAITAPAGGIGVSISALYTSSITLRSLKIDGQRSASTGIYVWSPDPNMQMGALHVENCRISNFSQYGSVGIYINQIFGQFYITDSAIRNCSYGMLIYASKPPAYVSIERSQFEHNDNGIIAQLAKVVIRESVIAGGAQNCWGVLASACATIDIQDSAIVNSLGTAAAAKQGATLRASNNTISNNAAGLVNYGTNDLCGVSKIESLGNNTVRNNAGNDLVGTITVISGQ